MKPHASRGRSRHTPPKTSEARIEIEAVVAPASADDFSDPWAGVRPGASIRALVINDHIGLLDALGRLLLSQPEVDLAGLSGHAEEAFAEVAALRPHVVILGLQMRTTNGLEATSQLRRKFPDISIIVTTSTDHPEMACLSRDSGADDIISKDRLQRDLLPAIRRSVAQHALGKLIPFLSPNPPP